MKPVNRRIRAKSGKIGHRGMRRAAKSGKTPKSKKGACLSPVVSKPTTSAADLPEIPGVDQLDTVPAGSKIYVANFFSDEVALLTKRATRVLDRTAIFIAPRLGWPKSIYWKPAEATK